MKIASLVLGIIALMFCWIPFFGLILSVIAVLISIVALVMAKKDPKNKGFAIAGIICSIIGLVVAGLLTFGIFMASNYLKANSNSIIEDLQVFSNDVQETANNIAIQSVTVNQEQAENILEAAQAQIEAAQKQLETQGL